MVFAGVGLVALPLDCIREFLGRPRSTISKSEYIKRAKGLGQRANTIRVNTNFLQASCITSGTRIQWDHNSLQCLTIM